MPLYTASPSWPKTARRAIRIIERRKMWMTTAAREVGITRMCLTGNLYDGHQPSPENEKRIVKWCDKHNAKKK